MTKRTKKGATPKDEITLSLLADAYAAEMERVGKSPGTIASYGMELKTAMAELGADMPLASLTPDRVAEYFACDRVNRLKSGKPKSPLSIAKTQRVLRLALVFAAEQKWIEAAPLPEPTDEPSTEAVA